MNKVKQNVLDKIIDVEGGYVNDPSDSGGETKYGITVAVARAYGFTDSMKELPRSLAEEIYSNKYWDSVKGDVIAQISPLIVCKVTDIAVNMGVVRASRMLQRVVSVLSKTDMSVDGVIGAVTVSYLKNLVDRRGDDVVVKALNCLQGNFYIELAERRPKDKRFIYGWLKNRVN